RPYLAVGWLWYGVTLLPVIGLIQVGGQSHADRYTYLPLIGIFILLTWGIYDATADLRRRTAVLSAAAVIASALCLALTLHQLTFWKDSEALFTRALDVTKNNDLAHGNLAAALSPK